MEVSFILVSKINYLTHLKKITNNIISSYECSAMTIDDALLPVPAEYPRGLSPQNVV